MDKKIEKKKWSVKRIATYGGASIFILFILINFVFGDNASKLNVEGERITVSEVRSGPFNENIPITGTVQPIETFYLDVTDGGRIIEKFVEEGAFLEEGDPILRLENVQLSLQIIYNEAQVFQQINSLRSTTLMFEQNRLRLKGQVLDQKYALAEEKRNFNTNKQLYEKNLISKIDFERSKDLYDLAVQKYELTIENFKHDSVFSTIQINQLKSSVNQLEQNLKITKKQLENLTIKAPIRGQLTSLNGEIGQSISVGQNLGQIDNIESYKIRAQVDEHYIARVAVGQVGSFRFANEMNDIVTKTVYPQVMNGRFEIDMYFSGGEQPDGIRRGQTVQIKLALGDLRDALMVDRGGFYQTTGGQWIFVLDESEKVAVKRDITIGQQNTQVYEILSGLVAGEKVITSSYDNFGDNDVLIIN
jgi:HlyD family secretion protein